MAAYGTEAASALTGIDLLDRRLLAEIVETAFAQVGSCEPVAEILSRFKAEEFARLKGRLADYIAMLLEPNLDAGTHAVQARRVGAVHAFVGLGPQWLAHTYSIVEQQISDRLSSLPLERSARAERTIHQRVLLDIREQAESFGTVGKNLTATITQIDRGINNAANLSDLIRGAFEAMSAIDGLLAGLFLRSDSTGELQVEATFGLGRRYHEAMEEGATPKIHIDANRAAGRGPGGQAWRSAEIVVAHDWMASADRAPWRSASAELGFRSGAAIPLLDESGRTIALLMLYSSFPGFFASNRIEKFLIHLQLVLGREVARRIRAPIVPMNESAGYRRLLDIQSVAVLYQPIVNLRDSTLVKVEALARLIDERGEMIPAQRFLPALGESDLLQLFEAVLRIACRDCIMLEGAGLRTNIAVNIPAPALADLRYREVLFAILTENKLAPNRLTLEMLETPEDAADLTRHERLIAQLRADGIEIEQDDLGSAHSSLVRLDRYPFDGVKIDQALVQGARLHPQRALEFILHLTRLAHALDIPVTVEGLENHGTIEAATILGADRGQGYGIARPMQARELLQWHADFQHRIDPQTPQTSLGAMAGFLLWDLQLAELARWPNMLAEFTRGDSIVERYRRTHAATDARLENLLARTRAEASQGSNHERYRRAREEVIKELHEHWISLQ
uniref:EAL domain-containing protein n=1 Tax=mine drainage metagenome TaxID=410659 RepID=E6Q497_9ZZZZ